MKMKTTARPRFALLIIGVGMALGLTTPAITQSGYEAINLTSYTTGGSAALAVNNSGQAVGWHAPAAATGTRAFSWTPTGGFVALSPVGLLGGHNNQAVAVNDSGQVVGSIWDSAGFPFFQYAFLWTQVTGIVDLGTLGGLNSHAAAINASGQVAGWSDTAAGPRHAFLWTPADGMLDLSTLGAAGSPSEAVAVNDTGRVVGWSEIGGFHHAFSWTASDGMVDLGTLGGPNSQAVAVNATDRIVGWSEWSDGLRHAFSWTPTGGMVDLGTLGGMRSEAAAVSATGQIVGWSEIAIGDSAVHAFSWTPTGGMVDLGTLGHRDSKARAVNAAGEVVGVVGQPGAGSHPDGDQRAFSWTAAGGMVDLGTLEQGFESYATALNESGDIVGRSTRSAPYGLPQPFYATMWRRQQRDDWTFCAPEGGVCAFTGTTEVRYGATGSFVYRTLTDGTPCTNEVFGDPIYGTVKECAIRSTTEWTFCAPENGVCAFTDTMEVRYGANGAFVYRTLTDGTPCTNEVFGDPIYGTVKQCTIRIPPPATDWTFCALENGVCAFTGTTEVRYGANGAWVYQTLTDGTACTNDVFGDPIYGVVKACSLRTASPSPPHP